MSNHRTFKIIFRALAYFHLMSSSCELFLKFIMFFVLRDIEYIFRTFISHHESSSCVFACLSVYVCYGRVKNNKLTKCKVTHMANRA